MNLSQSEIAGLYSRGNAQGASPLGLIVALYDTILRDLRRASDAITQGKIETRTFELNHALRVIAELENALNFERGADVARKLKNFYTVTRGMILKASIRNSREGLAELLEIFGKMRKAWYEAEQKMNAGSTAALHGPEPAEKSRLVPRTQEEFTGAETVSGGVWSA
jgi:flagellar secretion chaperone FliS